MSSYSFHGRAIPKLLTENEKRKPEKLVTKCKLSLCLTCFKSSADLNPQETKNVTNANEGDGSHASLRYSPSGCHMTEMKTVESSTVANRNKNMTAVKASNGNDIQIRLTPASGTQSYSSSLTEGFKPETNANSNSRLLEVKPSWTRTLSIISENATTEGDNHSVNEDCCNGQKKIKFPGMSPGISPVGSPRGSVGSLRTWESQGQTNKHRKEDLSRWKRIRKHISTLTMDPLFDMFITLCILVNTVFLSLEYHGMNHKFKMVLDIGNMVSVSLTYNDRD